MADLKKFFDISKLTDHDLGCVEFVLNSPAYVDVFKPYLEKMKASMQLQVLDRSVQRKEELPDDYLAGGIVAITGLLELFEKLVNETRMERMIAAQQRDQTTIYDQDQREGRHDPILGANEPIDMEQYRPELIPPDEDY